jgi:copper resistance protein C
MRIRPIIVLALLLPAFAAATALAHTDVSSTKPKRGSKAKTSIKFVTVTFDQQIRRGTISVTGPNRSVASIGKGARDPRNVKRLLVPLKKPLSPGSYRARWSVVAADGHKQKGSFRFRLRR